jgi:hypothetical protein
MDWLDVEDLWSYWAVKRQAEAGQMGRGSGQPNSNGMHSLN